jgi:hypothetical protein
MYLEIDEGFAQHRKTLRLCSLIGEPLAGLYLINLWTWAIRSCPTGELRDLGSYEIEEAARYRNLDGELCKALMLCGFIDNENGKPTKLHNWMDRTGGAIKRMDKKAKENRQRRADAKAKYDIGTNQNRTSTVPVRCENGTGTVPSRQDQTRPVQTSPKKEGGEAPPLKIRPRTPHDLEHCLRVAVQREQPQIGFWIPGRFSTADADKIIRDLGDIEEALPVLERKIEQFARDPAMQPWTVARFVDKWNEIGLAKLEFGKAPQPTPRQRVTPVKEW